MTLPLALSRLLCATRDLSGALDQLGALDETVTDLVAHDLAGAYHHLEAAITALEALVRSGATTPVAGR